MGYDSIIYHGAHAQFRDIDLWALRHFFLTEARVVASEEENEDVYAAIAFFDRWDWPGPGVFIGTDFEGFIGSSQTKMSLVIRILQRARGKIAKFGPAIPLSYLDAHVNSKTAYYTAPTPIAWFHEDIDRLITLLKREPNQAPEPTAPSSRGSS